MSENNPEQLLALEHAAQNTRATDNLSRGVDAQQKRLQQAASNKKLISIRLDVDTLERLKHLAGDGSYQALINRALAQWCDAMEIEALLQPRLQQLDEAIATLQAQSDE